MTIFFSHLIIKMNILPGQSRWLGYSPCITVWERYSPGMITQHSTQLLLVWDCGPSSRRTAAIRNQKRYTTYVIHQVWWQKEKKRRTRVFEYIRFQVARSGVPDESAIIFFTGSRWPPVSAVATYVCLPLFFCTFEKGRNKVPHMTSDQLFLVLLP